MAYPDVELDNVNDGVEGGTSNGESPSTSQQSQGRQAFNWQDDPAYREQQSKRDRELALARQEAEAARRHAAQIEQQVHDMNMRGLEGEERLAYQNQLLQRQLAEVQRQRDLDAFAIQRSRDLQEISAETGVPIEQIENANTVHDAWRIGKRWEKEQAANKGQAPQTSQPERVPDDRVDFGASKPVGKSSALQAKYNAARKAYDIRGQLEAMAEADTKGVQLDEW